MTGGAAQPYHGPYVWTARDHRDSDDWIVTLTDDALRDIDGALESVNRRAMTLDDIGAGDFPLPSLAADISRLKDELGHGRGFALIRGLPVERYSEEDAGKIFWGLGAALGVGVSQSYKGDRLGHVRDIGETGRYYTLGGSIEMHMDPVDVVGLLCLRKAARGGESRISSSIAVHNAIAAERPDLLPVLYRGFHYASRRADRVAGGPDVTPHRVPVFQEIDGAPACFYLPIAVRNTVESEGMTLSDDEREALELVDAVARRQGMYLEMDLEPGDMQFLNNRRILHGRTHYEDSPDPALKRHLLRLWLMIPDWSARPANMNIHSHTDRADGGIAPQGGEGAG